MSKEETPPAGGLLSKMVRFVRNPTVQWTELDSLQDDRESQYSKQMLKEMIERKRRNDFVRRREFDQLRKLRQREVLQGHRTEDASNRPSLFQSSMASPDERAVTLKKIDEIEAQMSQQWWKSKQSGNEAGETMPLTMPPGATQPAPGPDTQAADARAFAPTAPVTLGSPLAAASAAAPTASSPVAPLFANDSMAVGRFGGVDAALQAEPEVHPSFSPTVPGGVPPVAVQLERFVHEPDLEEAAISYANGDHEGAESGLLQVLEQHRQDDPEQQLELWMTLFDLYRATGQQDRFESLAIDFAAQYSRSAPLWFSLPDQLGVQVSSSDEAGDAPGRREFSWNAPQRLAVSSVAALQASVERAASPWTLAWSRIAGIDDAAVPLLADLFTRWADKQGQFVFSGVDRLETLLEIMTQSGDRTSGTEWWRLRMSALRLMGRPDEFELVALDYCVTFEVSPPSWAAPKCGYSDDNASANAQPQANERDMLASDFGELTLPPPIDNGPAALLSGVIEGDAVPLLQPLQELVKPGVPLVIACDKLMRIDFAAAGSVLNWAADLQSQGHVVHFQNLHRLIAVFFNVIGINEHAWVIPRKN
ncbi:STAS domain-containing protein [Acidovorax temperans]|uniref:STAS domain-containing protein n=1 Tax=Acidovorax temperans TaxID=80878 RepID=UPI001A94168C|nr:STAS domain-containing protein [Acidovorax temperans]MBO0940294.1 STAS domain-containing protein [Acidovorax temperans]